MISWPHTVYNGALMCMSMTDASHGLIIVIAAQRKVRKVQPGIWNNELQLT